MEKSVRMVGIIGLVIALVLLIGLLVLVREEPAKESDASGMTDVMGSPEMSNLEAMQLEPPKDYIEKLKDVIESDQDPYVRERGIFTLTEIAMRKNDTGEIVEFLKDIAEGEGEENVRTAAYATIDLIRDKHPLEKKGSLELSISGKIKKGADITLIARVSSTITPTEDAIVGITSLDNNIEMLSENGIQRFQLKANEPKEARFDLRLKETGEYYIPVTFMMSFDRIDYEEIHKEVHIQVNEADGKILE